MLIRGRRQDTTNKSAPQGGNMIMRSTRRDVLRYGKLAAVSALVPASAAAEESWPSKPIRIVCGYPAGGLTDIFARAYGEYIAQKTGQPVYVENKAGA